MKLIKYFFQFLFIIFILIIFKIIGLRLSRILASNFFLVVGPFFRSKKVIEKNISFAFSNTSKEFKKNIVDKMWKSYGKILAEYAFIKYFREQEPEKFLEIKGQEILEEIKFSKEPVIFISGHFDNFELMAMHIEKSGVDLAAIYRPLNNNFLNPVMENIRKKYICKNQIKKGIGGMKQLISLKKNNHSTALMIDQRVSEGIKADFFNQEALTTTIPAQLVKRFDIPVVPIFIERINDINFKITINKPLNFSKETSIKDITIELNQILEKMIISNPEQWIWSHNRWK